MLTKRHSLALEAFERYLSEGGSDIESARRDEVLGEVVRLREMVGFADVRAPEGAVVTVDDVERGRAPLPGPITIDAGVEHRVLAMKDNVAVLNRIVRVSGGQTLVVDAEAGAPAVTAEIEPAPEVEAEADAEDEADAARPGTRAVLGWTAVGVGAAVAIAGAVTGGLALSKNADIKDACSGGDCPPDWHDEVDRRDRLALATDVLLPVGAAVAVVGVLFLTVFKGEVKSEFTASRDGVMLGGRF
jgi:hypothetical protein